MILQSSELNIQLGGAQLGTSYGVADVSQLIDPAVIKNILSVAKRGGIKTIDTAPTYGDSQHIIGELASEFSIYTKIPRVVFKQSEEGLPITFASRCLSEARSQLKYNVVVGCYIHYFEDFLKNPDIWDQLIDCKMSGEIDKIGFSLYDPEQLDLIDGIENIDILQIPCNYLDRRFLQPKFLHLIDKHNIEVTVRSLFLQGLLTTNFVFLNSKFQDLRTGVRYFQNLCALEKLDLCSGALSFLFNETPFRSAVIGVKSAEQLEQIMNSEIVRSDQFGGGPVVDTNMIDPRNW